MESIPPKVAVSAGLKSIHVPITVANRVAVPTAVRTVLLALMKPNADLEVTLACTNPRTMKTADDKQMMISAVPELIIAIDPKL